MSTNETIKRLTEQKNRQRAEAIAEEIKRESEGQVTGHIGQLIEQLVEVNARLAEIEQEIERQKPDAERFAQQIGPIASATRKLREEVEKAQERVTAQLKQQEASASQSLKTVGKGFEEQRKATAAEIEKLGRLITACEQMVTECQALAKQCTSVYREGSKTIEEVAREARTHIAETEKQAEWGIEREAQYLESTLRELDTLQAQIRERFWSKTVVAAGMVALVVGLMTMAYMKWELVQTAETQYNSRKWEHLIEKMEKQKAGSGEEFNRQTEREMEMPSEGKSAAGANTNAPR